MTLMTTTAPKQPAEPDWQAIAKFWQVKYFEQLIHSTQVITMMGQPLLKEQNSLRQQAQAAAANNGVI